MIKNCPNCGAPIDIYRRSCEYCGTPYERDDIHVRQSVEMLFYADNKPVYIYQEPLNIDPIEVQKRILEEQNRRLRNELNAAIAGVNNANVFSNGMHGSETIEECCNALPRVNYGPLVEPEVGVIKKGLPYIIKIIILLAITLEIPFLIVTILHFTTGIF